MAPPAPPPPRLYAITATASSVAAVIGRTSGWSFVARWDTDRGAVEVGAWLKGKLYARRCDVSPDGAFLYYFAMKGGRPFHAISRLPWLTALALWHDNSTYTNGGWFERIPARGATASDGFLSRTPDQGDASPLAKQHKLRIRGHETTAYKAERVRGWVEHESCPPRARADTWDERRQQVLTKRRPDGRERLTLVDVGHTKARGAVEGRRPTYRLERGGEHTPLLGVAWADWDRKGRLLVATDDGALEVRNPDTGKIVSSRSMCDVRPDPQPSPPRLRRW